MMRDCTIRLLLIAFLVFSLDTISASNFWTHPDVRLNVYQLAAKHGYEMDVRQVKTDDDYLLEIHRIHGKDNQDLTNKPPLLLMHGIFCTSTDWINSGPNNSLAYILADLGFDVWLGNARGNTYGRKHVTLDPDVNTTEFWNFSFNEIGQYDLPAMIDYILEETKFEQLQYVGFSQGTTSFFVMASSRPEYNQKIKLATLLGPAAEMTHVKNPFMKPLAPFEPILYKIANTFDIYEILPRTELLQELGIALCDDGKVTQELCKIITFAISGYDREQLNGGFIPVITSNFPAGGTPKQIFHYSQVHSAKEFRQFDYHDEAINIEKYGSPVPPKYDFSKITAPVAMFYGANDWLASDGDAENVSKQLPNLVQSTLINYKLFNHFDFVWSIDILELLYNDVVELIKQYK